MNAISFFPYNSIAERLAQMYLMKMRHPNFNSNAGAVWRQLFVLSLLPWMRKHRVFSDIRLAQAFEALTRRKLEAEEDAKGVAERFGDDMQGITGEVTAEAEKAMAVAESGVHFAANSAADFSSSGQSLPLASSKVTYCAQNSVAGTQSCVEVSRD